MKDTASRDIDTRSYQGQGENNDSSSGKNNGTTEAENHEKSGLPTYAAALGSHQIECETTKQTSE